MDTYEDVGNGVAVYQEAPESNGPWMAGPPDHASVLAVVAHGLMNSIGVIEMASRMLRDPSCIMTDEQRRQVLAALDHQVTHVRDVLFDVIRGEPFDAVSRT